MRADSDRDRITVAIVGGGPAGVFAALAAKSTRPDSRVVVLEKTNQLLAKVRVSGGGRCNLTNATTQPRALSANYPRGSRELIGPFARFGAAETMAWFERHGVGLVVEDANRVFPRTGRSATVVDCLVRELESSLVEVLAGRAVSEIERDGAGMFRVVSDPGNAMAAHSVILAVGGGDRSAYGLASRLGHTIAQPAPSLYGLCVADPRIESRAGLSVADAELRLEGHRHSARGAVLVTHEGLSGPAVLRLSSLAARELFDSAYQGVLLVNWLPALSQEQLREELHTLRQADSRSAILARSPFTFPHRLWLALASAAGCAEAQSWAHLSRKQLHALVDQLTKCRLQVIGRSANKDEFVTCGGICLKEVDMRTMQSRLVPGLFLAGEVLDIDAFTGGYNLQAAWTTGYIAGCSAVPPARP